MHFKNMFARFCRCLLALVLLTLGFAHSQCAAADQPSASKTAPSKAPLLEQLYRRMNSFSIGKGPPAHSLAIPGNSFWYGWTNDDETIMWTTSSPNDFVRFPDLSIGDIVGCFGGLFRVANIDDFDIDFERHKDKELEVLAPRFDSFVFYSSAQVHDMSLRAYGQNVE